MIADLSPSGRLLADLALDLASSLEPRVVVDRVLRRAIQHVGADRATLSSIEGDEVVVQASFGSGGVVSWAGQRYPAAMLLSQPTVARALEQLGPAVGGAAVAEAADPAFKEALSDVKHTAAIPLVNAGTAIGMLVLSRYEDRPFSDRQLPALAALGQAAALALRTAEAHSALLAARADADTLAHRLRLALTASDDVAAQLTAEEALARLLERAIEVSGATAAAFCLLDGGDFIVEAATLDVRRGTRYPIDDAAALEQIRAGEAVHARPRETNPAAEYEHVVVVPLLVAGSVAGVVILTRAEGAPFTQDVIDGVRHFGIVGALLAANHRLAARR